MISFLLNLLRIVSRSSKLFILENVFCAFEKMCILLLFSGILCVYLIIDFNLICLLKPVFPFDFMFVVVWLLSCVQLSVTTWTAACQPPLSLTLSHSLLRFMSIEMVILSHLLILCHPFSFFLQSFPASGSFSMSQLFASGGQSIGVSASASVLPMNTQD